MAYDDVVARFTLAGSLISCIATCCVLVSYMVYRDELRSFRQALVLNLALAGTYFRNSITPPAHPGGLPRQLTTEWGGKSLDLPPSGRVYGQAATDS